MTIETRTKTRTRTKASTAKTYATHAPHSDSEPHRPLCASRDPDGLDRAHGWGPVVASPSCKRCLRMLASRGGRR